MRPAHWIAAATAALLPVLGLTAVTATAATVTVVNPDFDQTAPTASPPGWSVTGTAAASYTEATSNGYNGDADQLTHWSAAAYQVTTYQTVTGLTPGYWTLGVWTRSSGGDNSDSIALTRPGCGGAGARTAVPADADGQWVQIVSYAYVTGGQCTISLATDANAGDWTNFDHVTLTQGAAPIAIRGGDVSSLYRSQLDGGVYYTPDGTRQNALAQLAGAGMNWVRLRVWVNPGDGFDDEAQLLAMARQAHEYGQSILLDFHYSDTWADPGHQTVPAAWANDSLTQLENQVYAYSKQVVSDLVRQGTPPAMVQVGNEINNGLLWPDGSTSDFAQLAGLLKAGVAGVKAAWPPARIVLHLAGSWSESGLAWWYGQAQSYGVPFDVIGLSYYPFFHGTISQMKANVDALATQFGKPIVIAETQYAWTLANGNEQAGDSTGDFVWEPSQISAGYPASPGGQLSFVSDELSILAQVPNGLGMGLFYWAPEWIPGVGWEPGAGVGSPNVNLTLFDFQGAALPSIGMFGNPAEQCQSYDPWNVPCVIGG
jgi:arabinogalactan endo-1,4-beta-galactosidase